MALAQVNIAEPLAPLTDPQLAYFVENLDRINTLAESSPGFIWRLKDDDINDATTFVLSSFPGAIVNMSVWDSADALKTFVYETAHLEFLQRKKEWFHKMSVVHQALWFVEADHRPTLEEADARLVHLHKHGETDHAFNFKYLSKLKR